MISVYEKFSASCTVEQLHKAYLKCRKGKRKAVNTRGFEVELYRELQTLSDSLNNGSYAPSRSVCFYVEKPKLREIFAANFRDRVVHRLVVDFLEPHYEKKFISDSFACRTGKGTHRAVRQLRDFVRSGSKNETSPLYYLQLDIKGFFMEIYKPTLLGLLEREIADQELLHVLRAIVFHNPADNFVYRGRIPAQGVLPPHKTLFHEDRDRGIPIGNLTSQFFANIYLNELDQFVKRRLGVKYYLRYVDDFILMDSDPAQLRLWKREIVEYLQEHLQLTLKTSEAEPVSVYRGIDFLGYFVKPRYALVRRRVFRSYRKAVMETLPKPLKIKGNFGVQTYPGSAAQLQVLQARINSYLAHFQYANTHHVMKNLESKLKAHAALLRFHNGYIRVPRVLTRFATFAQQVRYFQHKFPGHLLIVPVGRFYEIYGRDTGQLAEKLQLKPYKRRSMQTYGIRKWSIVKPDTRRVSVSSLMKTAEKNQTPYVFFSQAKLHTERVKLRLPVYSMSLIRLVQLKLQF